MILDGVTIALICVLAAVAVTDIVLMAIMHRRDKNDTYNSIKKYKQ